MNSVIVVDRLETGEDIETPVSYTKTSDSGSFQVIRSDVPETNTIFFPEYISGGRRTRYHKKLP